MIAMFLHVLYFFANFVYVSPLVLLRQWRLLFLLLRFVCLFPASHLYLENAPDQRYLIALLFVLVLQSILVRLPLVLAGFRQ